jgi:ABC-type oligopeptide transport system substrate-binding subunit
MSWEAPVRFLVILAVAAFALAGCNANQGINPSGQAALCANDTGCNPYNPSSYAQNNTGHR